MQNATIEERVALLEIQVVEIQEDVSGLDEDVTLLEGDVNFLFDETVIQDERLFTLEQTSIETTADVEGHYLFIFHVCRHFDQNKSSTDTLFFRFAGRNSSFRFPRDGFGGERRE